jgi:hypothetical protein
MPNFDYRVWREIASADGAACPMCGWRIIPIAIGLYQCPLCGFGDTHTRLQIPTPRFHPIRRRADGSLYYCVDDEKPFEVGESYPRSFVALTDYGESIHGTESEGKIAVAGRYYSSPPSERLCPERLDDRPYPAPDEYLDAWWYGTWSMVREFGSRGSITLRTLVGPPIMLPEKLIRKRVHQLPLPVVHGFQRSVHSTYGALLVHTPDEILKRVSSAIYQRYWYIRSQAPPDPSALHAPAFRAQHRHPPSIELDYALNTAASNVDRLDTIAFGWKEPSIYDFARYAEDICSRTVEAEMSDNPIVAAHVNTRMGRGIDPHGTWEPVAPAHSNQRYYYGENTDPPRHLSDWYTRHGDE